MEKDEIKRFGGKAQFNSGRSKFNKGDAVLGPFVVDVKEYSKSYSVSYDSWRKICTDAAKANLFAEPALNLVLGSGNETVRLWVIGDGMFKIMLDAYQDKINE